MFKSPHKSLKWGYRVFLRVNAFYQTNFFMDIKKIVGKEKTNWMCVCSFKRNPFLNYTHTCLIFHGIIDEMGSTFILRKGIAFKKNFRFHFIA